jgi:SAM-dependent methyltransferase
MRQRSAFVRLRLERFQRLAPDARVLEVGSGAHGLVFFFGTTRGCGADPLAADYAALFPHWQRLASTVGAAGEALPFADGGFDVVLCDNVVDHAESPHRIVAELARLLRNGGLLYFTVNVHHPVYALASAAHGAWNAMGLRYEIGPFADHTVHLTADGARRLFRGLPLRRLEECVDMAPAHAAAGAPARHPGDRLKRLFFKNARYELIARKEAA